MIEIMLIVEKILFVSLLMCAFFNIVWRKRNKTESILMLALIISAELIMLIIDPLLLEIVDAHLQNFAWFNAFALIDILIVAGIVRIHNIYKVSYKFATKHILISYLTLGFTQLITYLDNVFIKSGVMLQVYPFAVVTLNLSIYLTLISMLLIDMFKIKKATLKDEHHAY